jgi:hypothetical protein
VKLTVDNHKIHLLISWLDAWDAEEDHDSREVQDDLLKLAGQLATIEAMPTIVVLCGSTRFAEEFQRQNLRLTLEGKIVLGIGAVVADEALGIGEDSEAKVRLDELHMWKIQLSDEVLVLNVGGYIGKFTRNEIRFAEALGRPVRYLEPLVDPLSTLVD